MEQPACFKMEVGEVAGCQVMACIDNDSNWVELKLAAVNAPSELSLDSARALAALLEQATNAVENISHRQYTHMLSNPQSRS